jgi:protein gp37
MVDGFYLWRDGPYVRLNAEVEPNAHAHFNLAAGARSALMMRDFVEHIDAVCRRDGAAAWLGEMNTKEGRRAGVLERYGAQIIDRRKNMTLSWLAGETIERLTVVRRVGEIRRVDDSARVSAQPEMSTD